MIDQSSASLRGAEGDEASPISRRVSLWREIASGAPKSGPPDSGVMIAYLG
jgi:hypothetical protein